MLRENRKRKTKALIIKQAIKLFKQKGYDNVTVEEITNACGIAKGTFFNYFAKKEHVLLQITDSYTALLDEIVNRHQQKQMKERLLLIFNDLLTIYFKHADLLEVTLVETFKSTIRASQETTNIARFQKSIDQLIKAAKENGSIHPQVDTGVVASILVGMFFQTLIHEASYLDQERIVNSLEKQLDTVWKGIGNE